MRKVFGQCSYHITETKRILVPAKIYRASLTFDEAGKSTVVVSLIVEAAGVSITSETAGGVGTCRGVVGLVLAACAFSAAALFRVV